MPTEVYDNKTLDARPDRLDLRDREYRPPLQSLPPSWPLPEDLKRLFSLYTSSDMILNQGSEGACTGFGLAAVINYLFWSELLTSSGAEQVDAAMMKKLKVSKSMLYNMAKIYDEWEGEDYEGSSCRGAMKGWHRHGVCTDETWPYEPGKDLRPKETWSKEAIFNPLGAYYRINKDSVVDMQSAIKEVGAIYCSASVHKGWWLDEEEALPTITQSKSMIGGHAFCIVGYNADGFIIQNSWGDRWGYKGFAILRYNDWVANGNDAWVAVRGAPVNVESSPHTFSNHSLQTIAADHTQGDNSIMRSALGYTYKNAEIMPWTEEEAYKHSLVIGNDGRPRLTMVSESDPEKSAERICGEHIEAWMKESKKNRKVVIYGHGGLNSEKDSINRIRIMAPYFKANGVYPLFVTWKTGFMESISNQIHEKVHDIFSSAGIPPSGSRAMGLLDKLKESIDRAIENTAKEVVVKGVWSEMKENAKYASDRAVPGYAQHGSTVRPGGMVILAKQLEKLNKKYKCELHLVGHSAGSILFGYWMDELVKRELKVASLTLYAPACTLEFAIKHYIKAHKHKVFKKDKTHMHVMTDEREKADNVAIYKKSLLYLVSRALEDIHKMPLLGMEAAWDPDYAKKKDIFNRVKQSELLRWQKFSKGIHFYTYNKTKSQVLTSLKGDYTSLAHGSFDNDIKVIEKTIKQIKGVGKLKYKVENLNGY